MLFEDSITVRSSFMVIFMSWALRCLVILTSCRIDSYIFCYRKLA